MDQRINFDDDVRDLAAKRAAYRCSFPDCGKITIGPGPDRGGVSCLGEASHIYAASPKGPRGQGGLSGDELKSIKNCIWLCRKHARLIDLERGAKYSASDLYGYRDRHESRVSRELGDLPAMDGWLKCVNIGKNPLFVGESTVTFGKSTVFIGPNGTGKTALLEWLVAAFTFEWPERWKNSRAAIRVQFEDSKRMHELKFTAGNGDMTGVLDDERVPFCPVGFRFLFVRDVRTPFTTALERIGAHLSLAPSQVRDLMKSIPDDVNSILSAVDVDADCLIVTFRNRSTADMSLDELSEGELQLVIVECAIAQARLLARHTPVVLLLDAGFTVFDHQSMSEFMVRVSGSQLAFQSVVVLCSGQPDLEGWQVYEFSKVGTGRTLKRWNVD